MMGEQIRVVDAFTHRGFAGNPAGVMIRERPLPAESMRNIAMEMNLSETAFLHPLPGHGYALRWFTPTVEVALCGHATLASAHTIWEDGLVGRGEPIRFETRSGELVATAEGDRIHLDFPARPSEPSDPCPGLLEALGVERASCERSLEDLLVLLESEETLLGLRPDHARLRELKVRGVIVTCRASREGFDFLSRFFAPGSGIDEDPVTGSAHCVLGPFWAARLGRQRLRGYQASRRGGIVEVEVGDRGRVQISGHAVTMLAGEWRVDVVAGEAGEGDAEVLALADQLDVPNPLVRLDALSRIVKRAETGCRESRLLPPLVVCLEDRSGDVRNAASTALGWLAFKSGLGGRELLEPALAHLEDEVPMVRHDAAWILESLAPRGITDPRALPLLVNNIAHDDPNVRAASIFCLGNLARAGVPYLAAIPVIRGFADDPDAVVRRAVTEALGKMG